MFKRLKIGVNPKIKSYLAYAIGEVILIFIGVYSATVIDDWRNRSHDRDTMRQQLINMRRELKNDSAFFKLNYIDLYKAKIRGLILMKQYIAGNYRITDTLDFIRKMGEGARNSQWHEVSRVSFNEMSNSGYLKLIDNDSLRESIIFYYENDDRISRYSEFSKSNYTNTINTLRVWDRTKPDSVSAFDLKFAVRNIRSDEMVKTINLELTHADFINRSASADLIQTIQLTKRIDQYLKNK